MTKLLNNKEVDFMHPTIIICIIIVIVMTKAFDSLGRSNRGSRGLTREEQDRMLHELTGVSKKEAKQIIKKYL